MDKRKFFDEIEDKSKSSQYTEFIDEDGKISYVDLSKFEDTEHDVSDRSPVDYNCPRCRSSQTQSFEVAYHGGTSQNNFSGSGYSYQAGNVNVSGTTYSQSNLAGYTSPPKRPNPFLFAVILTFVIPVLSFMPLVLAYFTSPFKFALYIAIDAGLIVGAYVLSGIFLSPPAWAKYKKAFADWKRSWICTRCGNTFYLN